ncbi:MAG: ADP-forming succinate--CoA ligase subunit beta [Armatimonadota bacterium]|nr:ADP-forming succinate--CoA ligase subunit beta [Armatimonadota bacterium]
MKLFEYQAKEIFARYGIPVPPGTVITQPGEVEHLALRYPLVLKAQVLVGGRGKAGGIKIARNPQEAREHAEAILGMTIKGEQVRALLAAEAVDIEKEYYLAFTIDRSARRVVAVASEAGGVDIEEVARETPEKIIKVPVDPFLGFQPFQARILGRRLGLTGRTLTEFAQIAYNLYRLLREEDAELAEINPLALTDGHLVAIDAKLILDDNASYRHPDRPADQEMTELERMAKEHDLSYVELDGDIAIIGNGAGLVMATLDMVAHFGGRPANFLDVGGGASTEAMKQALAIATRKPGIRVLFVNIFGGITRCDDIARGIVENRPSVPMVVRLTGTNEEEGRAILEAQGIRAFTDPVEAAQEAVRLGREPVQEVHHGHPR